MQTEIDKEIYANIHKHLKTSSGSIKNNTVDVVGLLGRANGSAIIYILSFFVMFPINFYK